MYRLRNYPRPHLLRVVSRQSTGPISAGWLNFFLQLFCLASPPPRPDETPTRPRSEVVRSTVRGHIDPWISDALMRSILSASDSLRKRSHSHVFSCCQTTLPSTNHIVWITQTPRSMLPQKCLEISKEKTRKFLLSLSLPPTTQHTTLVQNPTHSNAVGNSWPESCSE